MQCDDSVGHNEGCAQHPKQGTWVPAFSVPWIGACVESALPSH